MKKIFSIVVLISIVFSGCNSKKNITKDSSINIPYKVASGYFLKNNADISVLKNNKIESDQVFSQLFGYATVMGANGRPTAINFSTEYVIPIIGETTDFETEIKPVSLTKVDNNLSFAYKYIKGKKQTFTTKPLLILIVSKDFSGNIRTLTVE